MSFWDYFGSCAGKVELPFPNMALEKAYVVNTYFCSALESCEWKYSYSCSYKEEKIIFSKATKTSEALKTFSDRLRLANLAPKVIGKGTL